MFSIGQKVKVVADGEIGEVLAIRVDESGVTYTIASKEVDLQAKEIINGVKHLREEEVEEVTSE